MVFMSSKLQRQSEGHNFMMSRAKFPQEFFGRCEDGRFPVYQNFSSWTKCRAILPMSLEKRNPFKAGLAMPRPSIYERSRWCILLSIIIVDNGRAIANPTFKDQRPINTVLTVALELLKDRVRMLDVAEVVSLGVVKCVWYTYVLKYAKQH